VRILSCVLLSGLVLGFAAAQATAGSLTYTPTNPTFGGSPLNGTFLLSQAQAQGSGARSGQNAVDLSGLESALSNLGANAGSVVVVGGSNSNPTTPTNP